MWSWLQSSLIAFACVIYTFDKALASHFIVPTWHPYTSTSGIGYVHWPVKKYTSNDGHVYGSTTQLSIQESTQRYTLNKEFQQTACTSQDTIDILMYETRLDFLQFSHELSPKHYHYNIYGRQLKSKCRHVYTHAHTYIANYLSTYILV